MFPYLEDARFIVIEDEREVIATNVSTCSLQRQSHKGKLSSNEVFEWPILRIEQTTTHNKTTQTRTFLKSYQKNEHS
jgi:hypothetical protein